MAAHGGLGRVGARRIAVVSLVAGMCMWLVAPVARAAAPSNDNRADAASIGALPFDVDVDLSEATIEVGEPDCYSWGYYDAPASSPPLNDVQLAPRGNPLAFGLKASHEKPSPVTTNTVWYSYTSPADARIAVDTFGSGDEQDTILAVYILSEDGEYLLVNCNDDAGPTRESRVVFDAVAAQQYFVQLGAWYGEATAAHLHAEVAPPPGTISGTVTDDDTGQGIGEICVGAYGDYTWGWANTAADGTYSLAIDAGPARVELYDCNISPEDDSYYAAEFYDDVSYWEDATVVEVASGAESAGIDAGMALVEGNPWAPSDLAITDLTVEHVMPRVDGAVAPLGPGTQRVVYVDVANLGRGNGYGVINIEICPQNSRNRCSYLEQQEIELLGGEAQSLVFDWNGLGTVGDVEVRAIVDSCSYENNWDNNVMTRRDYVMIGGIGTGVSVRGGSRSYSCQWGYVTVGPPSP